MVTLDFTKCKTKEDVDKVFNENRDVLNKIKASTFKEELEQVENDKKKNKKSE